MSFTYFVHIYVHSTKVSRKPRQQYIESIKTRKGEIQKRKIKQQQAVKKLLQVFLQFTGLKYERLKRSDVSMEDRKKRGVEDENMKEA